MPSEFTLIHSKEYDVLDETLLHSYDFSNGLESGIEFPDHSKIMDSKREWNFENGRINLTYPSGMVSGNDSDIIRYSNASIDGLDLNEVYKIEVHVKLDKKLSDPSIYSNFVSVNYDWQLPVYDSIADEYIYTYGLVNGLSTTLQFELVQYGYKQELAGVNVYITDIIIEKITAKENHVLSGSYISDYVSIFINQPELFSAEYTVDDLGEKLVGSIFNEMNEKVGEINADWMDDQNEFIGELLITYNEIDYLLDVSAEFDLESLEVLIDIYGESGSRFANDARHTLSLDQRFLFTDFNLIDISSIEAAESINPFYITTYSYYEIYRTAEYKVENERGFIDLMPEIIEKNNIYSNPTYTSETLIPLNIITDQSNLKIEMDVVFQEHKGSIYCVKLRVEILDNNRNRLSVDNQCLRLDEYLYSANLKNYDDISWLKITNLISGEDEDVDNSIELNSYKISSFNTQYYDINGSLMISGGCLDENEVLITNFMGVINVNNNTSVTSSQITDDFGIIIGSINTELNSNLLTSTFNFNDTINLESFEFETDYLVEKFKTKSFEVTNNTVTCYGELMPNL